MREPAQVFHISEFLCEEIEARGWTTADVAARMKTPQGPVRDMLALDMLICVHEDNLQMGDEQCEGIARAFSVSPEFIRGLDDAWRAWPDRRSPFTPPPSVFSPHSLGAIRS